MHLLFVFFTSPLESLASDWDQSGSLQLSCLSVNMSSKWVNKCWSHRVSFSHVCIIPMEEREKWIQSTVTASLAGFKIWLSSSETKLVNKTLLQKQFNWQTGECRSGKTRNRTHIKTVKVYDLTRWHCISLVFSGILTTAS